MTDKIVQDKFRIQHMDNERARSTAIMIVLIYNLIWLIFCMGIATYAVFEQGRTGWWYAGAFVLYLLGQHAVKSRKELEEENE